MTMKSLRNRSGRMLAMLAALAVWAMPVIAQDAGASAAEGKEGESRYALDIHAGYASYQMNLKPDCWYPVWVTLQSRRGDLKGVISLRQPENVMVSHVPFTVAEGARKRYLTYYKFDGLKAASLEVTIDGQGLRRETMEYTQRYALDDEQYILALDEEAGRFRFLVRQGVEMTLSTLPQGPEMDNGQLPQSTWIGTGQIRGGAKVVYGDMAYLPDDPVALEGLDAMIINTPRVREMTPAQLRAVESWVAQGGKLMLAGGGYQPFIEQSVLKDAFGFAPGAPLAVNAAGILGEVATPGDKALDWIVAWPTGVQAMDGVRVELGDTGNPLIVSRQQGRGRFYYVATAFDEGFIEAINPRMDARNFWPRLLERHFSQSPLDTLSTRVEAITGLALQSPFTLNLVGVGWVLRFLGLYIFLALPLNWLVCAKLKRREWAWLVAVVLALGFAGYGYSSGLRSQEKEFIANEVTLLRHNSSRTAARATTFSAIFSPRRYNIDLQMPGTVHPTKMSINLNNMYGGGDQDLYSSRELGVLYSGQGVTMRGLFFYPWSARNLRADYTVAQAGGFEIAAPVEEYGTGRLRGTILNRTGMDFKSLWLVETSRMWIVEAGLADGASLDLAQLERSGLDGRQLMTSYKSALDRFSGVQSHTGPYGWQIDEAFTQMTQQGLSFNGLYVIGLADRTLSPLLDGVKLDQRKGLLFFEQELTNAMDKKWPLDQVTWKTRKTGVPMDRELPNYRGMINQDPGDGAALLYFVEEQLTLAPDRPADIDEAAGLAMSIDIKCFPDEDHMFQGVNHQSAYSLEGLGIRLYNRGSGQWDEMRLTKGVPLVIAPSGDYLNPASGEIALVADCRFSELAFKLRKEGGQEVEDGPLVSAEEIWGKKLLETMNNPAMPGMTGMPGMPGMRGMPGMPGSDTMCEGIYFKVMSISVNHQ